MASEYRPREDWKGSLNDGPPEAEAVLLEMHRIVGRKWVPVVVHHLLDRGPMRFSELEEAVDGISAKMLSETLDALEDRGLVDRRVVETQPLRVEYALTDRGRSLDGVVSGMLRWGHTHLPEGAFEDP